MSPGPAPEDDPSPTTEGPARVAARRRRLQALAGLTVHGSDGRTVGRVRDIYQQDASGELAAITVMPRQLSARSVLIPAAAIAALPVDEPPRAVDEATRAADEAARERGTAEHAAARTVGLRIDAATAKAGLRPPETLHASPEMLRRAAEALGLGEARTEA